jgi:hypothetical protein
VLNGIFPGSWIDANFSIWIGHADDQKAWSQLAAARAALDAAPLDATAKAEAREEVLIAEGSDWFWWYGDDHSSENDQEFDDLFRRHLRNAYRRLQTPVPDELYLSNISTGAAAADVTPPIALLAPTLDGEETSYFEWLGAGILEIRDVAGAMHRADHRPPAIALVLFGFDRERLFIRLDGAQPMTDLLTGGLEVSVKFFTPEGVRFSVRRTAGQIAGSFWDRRSGERAWVDRGSGGAALAAGTVLELALPLADLQVSSGQPVSFIVAVYDGDVEVERHPANRPIELEAPDERFEAHQWRA